MFFVLPWRLRPAGLANPAPIANAALIAVSVSFNLLGWCWAAYLGSAVVLGLSVAWGSPSLAADPPPVQAAPPDRTTPPPPADAPSLVVERTEIDAGRVLRGDAAHFEFVLKNTGGSPLTVDAKPTCGCTVAQFDKSIPPGGQGKVEGDLRTADLQGQVRKTIRVTTNDPRKPSLSLTITANVEPVLKIERIPGKVLALKAREPTTEEFLVRLHPSEPAEVTGITSNAAHAKAALEPLGTGAEQGRAYRVRLTVEPTAPPGRSYFTLSIATTSKREPMATVQIACEKGIVVAPIAVDFGQIGPQTPLPVSRSVFLRRSEGPFPSS